MRSAAFCASILQLSSSPPSRKGRPVINFQTAVYKLVLRHGLEKEWKEFNAVKVCTVGRAPCVKRYRAFCVEMGGEFAALLEKKQFKFKAIGTRNM